MGIVGGYELHLYCDADGCKSEMFATSHINYVRCCRIARREGWIINDKDQKAYCPECAKQRRKQKKDGE